MDHLILLQFAYICKQIMVEFGRIWQDWMALWIAKHIQFLHQCNWTLIKRGKCIQYNSQCLNCHNN